MTAYRRSDMALAVLAVAIAATVSVVLHAGFQASRVTDRSARTAALARDLGLTDLALFTDARYTRHPSQADLHSAFQDHPLSLDHFPSGSLVAPPRQAFGNTGPSAEEPEPTR